ncbi:MAG: hypothetical protein Q8P59_08755, partial [Dehalococcoidia bacterium]|nr:hypothetical protein [Dehalococcoidia bacterium]
MGLSGLDWLRLAGVAGQNLRIGRPRDIRRGGGFRPFQVLGAGAELAQNRSIITGEEQRRTALGALIQEGNQAIAAAPDPIKKLEVGRSFMGKIAPLTIPAVGYGTHGASRDVGAGAKEGPKDVAAFLNMPTKEEIQTYYDDQAARAMKELEGTKRTVGDYLVAGSKSPTLMKSLESPEIRAQRQIEGSLEGPARYQAEQAAILQSGVD